VPTTAGNDTAPDDEQVAIYFRPFSVGERGGFLADLQCRAKALVGAAKEAAERVEALADGEAPDPGDVQAMIGDSDDLRRYVFERVTRGERGADKVDGWRKVWDRVEDDQVLVDEIVQAIIKSAGVGKGEAPFSGSPTTGG